MEGQSNLQPVANVPITITNTQDIATPSPFQVMITVNSAQYATYEASDLSNIAFSASDGTIIPSWLESGNSNSATNTVYWLKVESIPADSSITISMNFYSTSTNVLNGQTTGEAPDLSNVRGQCDNGANVFIMYADFLKGLSGWLPYQTSGDFVPVATPNGVQMINGVETTYLISPVSLPSIPIEVEEGWNFSGAADAHGISMFGSSPFSTSPSVIESIGYTATLANSIGSVFDYYQGHTFLTSSNSSNAATIASGACIGPGGGNFNLISFLTFNGTWASTGYATTQSVSLEGFGLASIPIAASGNAPGNLNNPALLISGGAGWYSSDQYTLWVVARALPPNSVSPSFSIGTLVAGPPSPTPQPIQTAASSSKSTVTSKSTTQSSPTSPATSTGTLRSSSSASPTKSSTPSTSSPQGTPSISLATLLTIILPVAIALPATAFGIVEHQKSERCERNKKVLLKKITEAKSDLELFNLKDEIVDELKQGKITNEGHDALDRIINDEREKFKSNY